MSDTKFAIEYDFSNQDGVVVTDHVKGVVYAKTCEEANKKFNMLVNKSTSYSSTFIKLGKPSFLGDSLIDIFTSYKVFRDGKIVKDLPIPEYVSENMNSIYKQMNKIDDNESLNEKYNVRTLKDIKKLNEDYFEDEIDDEAAQEFYARAEEALENHFHCTGAYLEPSVQASEGGLFLFADDVEFDGSVDFQTSEEYVRNDDFDGFLKLCKNSFRVKTNESLDEKYNVRTLKDVKKLPESAKSEKVERPKGFKGSVGGYLAVDRYGIWVSSKPNSGGVKISDANYDWIKENFKLTTLPEGEYKTIWGRGTVYKIERKDTLKESVDSDNNIKKLQDAAARVKCKLTPEFIEYALDDPDYIDDVIDSELLYCGETLCKEFPNMISWEFGEDKELCDIYGNYCVIETGTDEGRILVQIDGHGRIYILE